jgi:hypothetical protein
VDLRGRLHQRFFRTRGRRRAVVATGAVSSVIASVLAVGLVSAGAATTNGDQITWAQVPCVATVQGSPLVQPTDVAVQAVVPNTAAQSAAYSVTIPGGTANLPSSGGGFAITGFKDVSQTYLFRSSSGSPQITSAVANGVATSNGDPVTYTVTPTNEGSTTAISNAVWDGSGGGRITFDTSAAHNLFKGQIVDTAGFQKTGYNLSGFVVSAVPTTTQFTINGRPLAVSAATWAGSVITYTTAGRHQLNVGDKVTMVNQTPARYAGTKTVTGIVNGTQFTTAGGTTDPGPIIAKGSVDTLADPTNIGTSTLGSVKTVTAVRLNSATATPGPLTVPDVTVNMTAPAANSTVTTYTPSVTVTATLVGPGDAATQCIIPHATPQGDGISATVVGTGGPTTTSSPKCRPPDICIPAVTGVTPSSGGTGGGTSVTIAGSYLNDVTAVSFGGTPASSFTVDNGGQITATAPAHAAGTVDITVTSPTATSATSADDQFTYAAGPSVTSVTPSSGPTAGGTSVIIAGSGFTGATAVSFGATAATTFTVDNANQITATAPAQAAGTVDVTVTAPSGTSPTGASDQYTYLAPPTITSVTPSSGPTAGGTSVVIAGTNLTDATAVSFGATAATSFTVDNANQITATAPLHAAGTVDVTATTPGGTSATGAGDQYTFVAPPTITSVSPSSGPSSGGTSVTITGTNLSGATAVSFGATAATTFTVDNATQITATAPAHAAGTVDITATTAGGTSATGAGDQYTYVGPPTVTSVSPTSGPAAGGTSVVITGTGFTGATAVSFGATAATTFTVDSATKITATAPAHAAGTVDITVTTNGGTSTTGASDQFTYVAAPTVTSVSPTSGTTAGGTSVVITGTNLTGASAVSFGGTAATTYTVDSATQITATSPAHAAGAVDVTVTTVGGTSATGAGDQYTFVTPPSPPTVTGLAPTSGPAAGGTSVVITGTNFSGVSAVSFGGTASTTFTVDSATQITATAPAHAAGVVDVTVTAAGGTSTTGAGDQYTYVAAPTVTSVTPSSGTTAGGTSVVIAGTNFTGATAVSFGATAATTFTVDNAGQITATSPAHAAGTVDVRVTTTGGQSATGASDQYTYVAGPTVTSVTPSSGTTAGGTSVVIAGTNFTGATAVSFGGTAATTFTVDNAGQITATSPAHAAGTVDVTVTTTGGTSATGAGDQYTYTAVVSGCGTSCIVVGDKAILETDSLTKPVQFPVTLSQPANQQVTVHYTVTDGSATGGTKAGTGADYKIKSGTLTFKPSTTTGLTPITKTIAITEFGDTTSGEGDETFSVTLDTPTGGYVIGPGTGTGTCGSTPGCATGTILNDDGGPGGFTLGVGDGSIFSARSGKQTNKIPVTLSGQAGTTVTVDYLVVPGSATWSMKSTDGGDYGGKTSGTLTFTAGQTVKQIASPIYADPTAEPNQSYTIVLSNVNGNGTGVTLIRSTGTGTILGLP